MRHADAVRLCMTQLAARHLRTVELRMRRATAETIAAEFPGTEPLLEPLVMWGVPVVLVDDVPADTVVVVAETTMLVDVG